MKRLFVLSLVAVLSVGLLSVGAFAQPAPANDQSDNTYVEWTIDAPMQCSLTLDAHDGINLGTLDQIGVNYSASAEGYSAGARTITTSSNCAYTVTVDVPSVAAPIGTNEVLQDFGIALISKSGPNTNRGTQFSGTGFQNPASWGGYETTLGTAGDSGGYGQVDNASWEMDYSYLTDYNDSNDYYRVNLEYTASAS